MSVAILRCMVIWVAAAAMPLSLVGQSPSASPPAQAAPEQAPQTESSPPQSPQNQSSQNQASQAQPAQNQATPAPGPPPQGAPAAVLHTQGGVWINGSEARDSTAVFAGDLIETKPGFSAMLNLDGAELLLAPEAVAKFNGDSLALDHGSVSVGTAKSFKVQVNCLSITPAASVWTQYEVSDVNGTVQVAARKADVNVQGGHAGNGNSGNTESSGGTVHEGEQKSFDEAEMCGKPAQPAPPAHGISPAWIAAGAAGTGVLIWILVHGTGGGQSPITPSSP